MEEPDFIPEKYLHSLASGSVSYDSPSNIALIKYWGKYGDQLPKNASVSFTLDTCKTTTTLSYQRKSTEGYDFEVFLDGQREASFEPKISTFFERIEQYVPFLNDYTFRIETHNSFPHSSGIASSASGMSALAMCLVEMERTIVARGTLKAELTDEFLVRKASFLARLGSGSAARSIQGPLVVWGAHPEIPTSSNVFGVNYPLPVHDNFKDYRDTILLVDKGEKQVSSTVGHDLMHSNPYAEERFKEANANVTKLISIFASGNLSEFIALVESEALQLHAMMMASKPYFILMKPNTLEIINRIWKYRQSTGSHVCFTLDAGANVHVLYPNSEKDETVTFIENELAQFCKNQEFIHDKTGSGSKLLE